MNKMPTLSRQLYPLATQHHQTLYDMPFFPNAQGFEVKGTEMNDVAGNLTKNETNTTTTNSDVGNVVIASNVSKGNTTTQDAKIGKLRLDCFSGEFWLIDSIGCRKW